MATDQAKALLRERGGIAETPNAELEAYRGLAKVLARGAAKATSVALPSAVDYNHCQFATRLGATPLALA